MNWFSRSVRIFPGYFWGNTSKFPHQKSGLSGLCDRLSTVEGLSFHFFIILFLPFFLRAKIVCHLGLAKARTYVLSLQKSYPLTEGSFVPSLSEKMSGLSDLSLDVKHRVDIQGIYSLSDSRGRVHGEGYDSLERTTRWGNPATTRGVRVSKEIREILICSCPMKRLIPATLCGRLWR